MNAPACFLRAFDPKVYDLCEPYRVTDDALMPEEYRRYPNGRWRHDDFFIMKDITRKETARRVPGPFKQISGESEKKWVLWSPEYPTVPGTPIELREYRTVDGVWTLPHALIDCAVEDSGWSEFAVWLNEEWVPCFKSYRRKDRIFNPKTFSMETRRLAYYSGGLKFDSTCSVRADGSIRSDQMGWWDPPTASWNKVTK